ncbi:hypothetical protein DOW39_06160 [Salmonella enterica subsp. enterica serovar Tanger]|nr:hypothetical protein [Salmonella enterica subsp. enterica serovar Tanger]EBV4601247.1 hypothetical protein [Salmonella enterica subsp. enterica serovar Tanger]
MSIEDNGCGYAFGLIVKYGLHVKPSENSASGKRYASVGYAVSESRMEYIHEELTGNPLDDEMAYRKAVLMAAQSIIALRGEQNATVPVGRFGE